VKRAQLGIAGQLVNLTERMIVANKLSCENRCLCISKSLPMHPPITTKSGTPTSSFEFEGKPIGSVDDLHQLLTETVIGKTATLGILRGGRKQPLR
jgi:S1-C subfamily serine protease